jgi:hypothetical protein
MQLIIDRKLWLRGEQIVSYLLRFRDGKMCCLGIYGRALGIPAEELLDKGAPDASSCRASFQAKAPWLFKDGIYLSRDCKLLMEINDFNSDYYDEPQYQDREDRIKEIFAENGVEVSFVD